MSATRTPTRCSRGSATLPEEGATRELQDIYGEPVKPELIAQRIREIKAQGAVVAGALTPQAVRRYCDVALDAGLDVLVVQGTVVSAEHVSQDTSRPPLNLKEFIRELAPILGGRRRLRLLPHGSAP